MTIRTLASSVATAALMAAMPLAIALPMGLTATAVQAQQVNVNFNVFYDRLRPHGVWVRSDRHRFVWCPAVDRDWRPYTRGRWVYLADRGWYFASDEPFAWAAYHYGRWYDDDRLGWCWVPGSVWAPAWVTWRRAPDYIGWAPLPPQGDGFAVSIEVNVGEPPEDDWFFVPTRSFLERNLSVSLVYAERDPEIYRRTELLGPVIVQNNTVINTVIDIDIIQQETGQQVEVVQASQVEDPEAAGGADGGTVPVFDPELEAPAEDEAPPEAVEPEEAEQQLNEEAGSQQPAETEGEATDQQQGQPANAETPANSETPANEAAPAEQGATEAQSGSEAPANEAAPSEGTDDAAACPAGEAMKDGACVAVEAEAQAGGETPAEQAPADQAPAEQAPAEQAPAQNAPAEQAPAEPAQPAEPTQPAEPAQATESAQPAEPAQPADAAPAQQQPAAPAAPCPEGQVPAADGACRPAG
jgi:hypothetical protein